MRKIIDPQQTSQLDPVELWHEVKTIDEGRDGDFAVAELYHEASKQYPSDIAFYKKIEYFNGSDLGRRLVEQAGKRYACAHRHPLPKPQAEMSTTLVKAIAQRRSCRRFSGDPVGLGELATVLGFGNGFLGRVREDGVEARAIPSGGGLYPTETYVLPLESELPLGAYHYDPQRHELARFRDDPAEPVIAGACSTGLALATASVALVITACFERQRIKYGERAYRFALLECGHLAQNILLTAAATGIGALPVGGFLDDQINSYLRLDGCDEASLYIILLGAIQGAEVTRASGAPR